MEKLISTPTPYFVIDVKKVDTLLNELKTALNKYWPTGIVGYSFKTNNLPWIITYMKAAGLWAEVVSSDEYLLAKELGYPSNKIIFNGPVKGKKEFIEAVQNGAIVNLDSNRELEWLKECDKEKLKKSRLGLRVNFCLEDYCKDESQNGEIDGRFGFSYEKGELKKAIHYFLKNNIPLSGLHLHCSSKTRSINIYRAIANMALQIVCEYGLNLKYIDIGGGFFGGVENKPSFMDYFTEVYRIFKSKELLKNVNIIVEPGMSLIGASVDYVATVVDTKSTKNNSFAVLDGSRIHIDPLMRKKSYSYKILKTPNIEGSCNFENSKQILCGFTCMESDIFFELNSQNLNVGDKIVFEKVGAYTMGLSPLFIQFFPPVYAIEDGQVILARSKFTEKNFII